MYGEHMRPNIYGFSVRIFSCLSSEVHLLRMNQCDLALAHLRNLATSIEPVLSPQSADFLNARDWFTVRNAAVHQSPLENQTGPGIGLPWFEIL